MVAIVWDSGTAYDFLISLFVLHRAADFGLRPSWAAGVRQRIPSPSREFLEQVYSFAAVPLDWIHSLPDPKDAATVLRRVADLDAGDRLEALTIAADSPPDILTTLRHLATRGSWTQNEKEFLEGNLPHRGKGLKPAGLEHLLKSWSRPRDSGERLLAALTDYHQAFFAEEEARIRPMIAAGLQRARQLSEQLSVHALVEELSRGVRLEEIEAVQELILTPSYWSTPLIFLTKEGTERALIAFGTRSEVESVAPGAETPDLLVNALKSLGDPTRLRILRYLAGQPLTPTELARRLRLRPPTVIHHLHSLRLAGLVSIIISESGERRYAGRLETLSIIYTKLQEFLVSRD